MKTILNITLIMRSLISIKCVSLIIALSVLTNTSIAQSTIHDTHEDGNYTASKFLTFGQSIEDYNNVLNENISWKVISSADKKVISSGAGLGLSKFKFDIPGKYTIEIDDKSPHDKKSCGHSHMPSLINVEVSGVQMTYDFSRIKFSEKIVKCMRCDQITVSVPIRVVLVDEKPVTFNIPDIRTAGIGTEIIAIPVQRQIELVNGEQILNFKLSGVANDEAYIMFDFVDINNQVQPYSHLEFIK